MKGRRVYFSGDPHEWESKLELGDYCKWERERMDGTQMWIIRCPTGELGGINNKIWNIEEHPDGTITVNPSIQLYTHTDDGQQQNGWHGYLRNGEWITA